MKYVSVDIETSGLDPHRHQILEFGAVIEDTDVPAAIEELPSFHRYIFWDQIVGDPYALAMNHNILSIIGDKSKWENINILPSADLGYAFWNFIDKHFNDDPTEEFFKDKITVAGKNFGSFDNQFLKNIQGFFKYVSFEHRFLDPGSIFFDPSIDKKPPGLETCLERVGIKKTITHTAVEDAKDVIRALRGKLKYHDGK